MLGGLARPLFQLCPFGIGGALLWAFHHERLHGFEGGVELVHAGHHPGELRLRTDAHTKHTG